MALTGSKTGWKTGWKREMLGLLAAVGLVVVAYHAVVFQSRTFDTSGMTLGVNGHDLPIGLKLVESNEFRVDPGASAWQNLPWAQVVHRQIEAGDVPLWNPYQGSGAPLAANAQSAVFDPLMAAVNLHPTPLVWDLTFLFAFALGSITMELFLRKLRLSTLAALAGTSAFVMCGYFASHSNLAFVRIYAYVPLLLLLIDRVVVSPKLRWVAALGLAIGGTILAGMPEASFFVLATAAAYAVYRLVRNPPGAVGPRRSMAFRLSGAGSLGLLFGAPLLVLFLGYLPLTFNVHGTDRGLSVLSRATLLNWVIPFVNGYPAVLRVKSFATEASWIGAAGAVLLLAAVASPRAMRRHAGWFFLVLGMVLLLKVHDIPGLQWIGKLPVADRTLFPGFAPPVVGFCFAVLVAIAVEAIVAGEVRLRWLLPGMALAGVVVVALLLANRPVLRAPLQTSPYRQYLVYAEAVGAGGVAAAACLASIRFPRWRRPAGVAAAGMVAVELLVFFAPGAYGARLNPYQTPPWLGMVTSGMVSEPQARIFGFDAKLYPDISGAFGIQDVRELDALLLNRYRSFIGTFVGGFPDRFTGDLSTPSQVEANPMFDLLGVRYVLAGSTQLDTGSGQYRLLGTAGGVSVYENGHRAPRAFVVGDVHTVAGEAAAFSYLRGLGHPLPDGTSRVDGFDPTRQAVVETPGGSQPLPETPTTPTAPARPARITSYEAEQVVIDVPAGTPGLLVLTDTFAPGWQATVNGRAASLLPTDVAFRGVVLGDGAARVVLRYHPAHESLGLLLPLAGVAALIAVALFRRQRAAR